MPSASHDGLPEQEIAPGYSSRFADWGGITVAFEKAHAGQDASAMVKGLPGRPLPGTALGLSVHRQDRRRLRRPERDGRRRARRTTSSPAT